MSRPVEIAPSVLPADYSKLGAECVALQDAGVDRIQWDVMDGVFVPNLTFGPDVIASIRPHIDVVFEAHLMVVEPDRLLHRYVEAGCGIVIVHAEACTHLHRTLAHVAELGVTPGVALNPHTPTNVISQVRDLLGMVLVMTVNPGFGGQAFIESQLEKIAVLREKIDATGRTIDLEVDGGITSETAPGAIAAGAGVLVAGTATFKGGDGAYADNIAGLRGGS